VSKIKRLIKFIVSSAICILLSMQSSFIFAEETENIVLLGDSITTGFGLSENELSYGDYLENYYNAEVNNFAVNGLTTQGLIDKLSEEEVVSSITDADLICISIGGNDFLSIFQKALSETNDIQISSDGQMNISSEFVSKFIMDYSSAFSAAAVSASENITQINDIIYSINPDADMIMQTVYNPFESADEQKNTVLSSLKTFSSLYMTTLNNAVKEVAPNTADIYLKFYEKPYLYTNIENYDIHPNYLGHLLIAEEIVQTLQNDGDISVFTENIYNIPQGIFSEIPSYTADELNDFAQNQFRRGTLEQTIQRSASAVLNDTEESDEQEETVSSQNDEQDKNKTSKRKNILSKIFMIIGFSIIILVTFLKFVRERKKYK